jgi:hypothetical protein
MSKQFRECISTHFNCKTADKFNRTILNNIVVAYVNVFGVSMELALGMSQHYSQLVVAMKRDWVKEFLRESLKPHTLCGI